MAALSPWEKISERLKISVGLITAELPTAIKNISGLIILGIVAGCASPPAIVNQSPPPAPISRPDDTRPASLTMARLLAESRALTDLAQSDLGRRFLLATTALPAVAPRKIWRTDNQSRYLSVDRYNSLPAGERTKFTEIELDEYRYYYTKYGSPLSYLRPLDVLAKTGLSSVANKRILDFGYGSIGHLRLLASLGAVVTGVDIDSYLEALYSRPEDQGRFGNGSVTLTHGNFPKDANVKTRVGNGYDLIISKNTLKRGYLKPERKVDQRLLVTLGVSDEIFIKSLFDALNPGGKLLLYNISPKAADKKADYKPWADGRSPFAREKYEAAGFRVIAYDENDDSEVRAMGHALQWDKNDKGETIDILDENLFALYTLVERP